MVRALLYGQIPVTEGAMKPLSVNADATDVENPWVAQVADVSSPTLRAARSGVGDSLE
jgi:hypothetical protein